MRLKFLIKCFSFALLTVSSSVSAIDVSPRSVEDILAILDEFKPDPAAVNKLRADASAPPPDRMPAATDLSARQELAIFFQKRARANNQIGNTRQEIDDLTKALEFVWTGSRNIENAGLGDAILMLEELANAESRSGNLIRTLELRKRTIQMGNKGYSVFAWMSIASINAIFGDMNAAQDALREAEKLLAELRGSNNWIYHGHTWTRSVELGHGALLEARGNFSEAERRYRRALLESEAWHKVNTSNVNFRKDTPPLIASLGALSTSELALAANLRNQGLTAEAETFARSALRRLLEARGRFSASTAFAIVGLGRTIYAAGRFGDAALLARAAVESYEKSGAVSESLGLAEARRLLGDAFVARGSWNEAVKVFEERDAGLKQDAVQYAKLGGGSQGWGIALLKTGQSKMALEMLEPLYRQRLAKSLKESEYFTALDRAFYAMALAANGQTEEAFIEFRASIPPLLEDARRFGSEGAAVDRQMRTVWALEAFMKLLIDLRDSPMLKAAGINPVEEAFRIADVARGGAVQRALSESAARATPGNAALADLARRLQEAQRREVVLSNLRNRLLSAPAGQQLPKVSEDMRKDIEMLSTEVAGLKQEMTKKFPEYAELISPNPVSVGDARAALKDKESLLSIYVGSDRTYIWAIPKVGPYSFSQLDISDDEISKRISNLRKALDVGEVTLDSIPKFDFEASYDLYKRLLAPVEDGWRNAENLIVVPHKALGQLPFATLITKPFLLGNVGGAQKLFSNYRSAPWLARQLAISQLPSVNSLGALRRTPPAANGRKAFIGFGDPIFSKAALLAKDDSVATRRRFRNLQIETVVASDVPASVGAAMALPKVRVANVSGLAQLARLPETADEIYGVARALEADADRDVFLGRAASEMNVKSGLLEHRRIVMFATHGLVPGDLSGLTQPALALSAPEVTGNTGEDGLLTMEEVLGLKLNADWVVLSACNTAAGEGAGAEAVSGLGKAFFFAGARTLLVSNWPVETMSAKLLTTKLFEFQGKNPTASRASALRATMIDLLDHGEATDSSIATGFTYAHPMFWAPFSLVGDGGH